MTGEMGELREALREVLEARAATRDDARKTAVDKQHARGRWTAREGANINDSETTNL